MGTLQGFLGRLRSVQPSPGKRTMRVFKHPLSRTRRPLCFVQRCPCPGLPNECRVLGLHARCLGLVLFNQRVRASARQSRIKTRVEDTKRGHAPYMRRQADMRERPDQPFARIPVIPSDAVAVIRRKAMMIIMV